MKEVSEFISAVSGLLLVTLLIAGFVLLCFAIFRPPAWLRDLVGMWRESRRTVKRLKAAGIEAEFEDRSTPTEAVASEVPPAAPESPATLMEESASPDAESKFFEAIGLLHDGKYAEGMVLIRESVASETDHDKIISRVAFGQYIGFDRGSREALADLRATTANNPRVIRARLYLADALGASGETEAALRELRAAMALSASSTEQAEVATKIGNLLHRTDRAGEAKEFMLSRLREAAEPAARAVLAAGAAKLFDGSSVVSRDHALALYEIAHQSTPNDQSLLFDLGYAASKFDAEGTAYMLYKELVQRDPSHVAGWNNLGVAADRLHIPASAVRAYRRAEALHHSLAMSNLAQLLINAGFLEEAAALLETARAQKKVDDHVLAVTGRLATAREEDRKRNTELASRGETLRKWRQRHAHGLLGSLAHEQLSGTYVGTDGLKFVIEQASATTVAGTFDLDSTKSATFTGHVQGQLLLIAWKTVAAKPPAWHSIDNGRGVLVADTPESLSGFRLASDKVIDVDDIDDWVLWNLRRVSQSA
jgi:tetratricopeptide (TPR) repeat protein